MYAYIYIFTCIWWSNFPKFAFRSGPVGLKAPGIGALHLPVSSEVDLMGHFCAALDTDIEMDYRYTHVHIYIHISLSLSLSSLSLSCCR